MVTAVRARAEAMVEAAKDESKVTLTDLSRSNAWRKQLSKKGILQLMDRSDTAGFIISVDSMKDLLDSLNSYESEIETMEVQGMLEARKDHTDYKTGSELVDAVDAVFDSRYDAVMKALGEETDTKNE